MNGRPRRCRGTLAGIALATALVFLWCHEPHDGMRAGGASVAWQGTTLASAHLLVQPACTAGSAQDCQSVATRTTPLDAQLSRRAAGAAAYTVAALPLPAPARPVVTAFPEVAPPLPASPVQQSVLIRV
jgi:hypothetical protein